VSDVFPKVLKLSSQVSECKPLDAGRNDAYDAAITAAVTRLKKAGRRTVDVIDAGAGSGLLSMMSARAGATNVTAVEQAAHMVGQCRLKPADSRVESALVVVNWGGPLCTIISSL